jgi:uncharacterized protein DUF4430
MRLSRGRLIGATVALSLIPAGIATALPCPSLRVEAPAGTVIPADNVCSTRAYLDTTGTARALVPKTVLGQLVAAAGSLGYPLGIAFDAQLGGFVSSIGGVAPGPNGFWELLVDNRASQTGASTTILKPSQEVVWVLDTDFNKPGPFVLDMDVVRASNGVLAVRMVRTNGTKITPAKGARVHVNNLTVTTNANGRARIRLKPNAHYSAVATLPGSIRSQVQSGQV